MNMAAAGSEIRKASFMEFVHRFRERGESIKQRLYLPIRLKKSLYAMENQLFYRKNIAKSIFLTSSRD